MALELPEQVQRALDACVGRWRARPWARGWRWVPAERRHLTLAFLGDVALDAVTAALRDVARVPFDLELAGHGRFPPRGAPRVLWAGVGGDLSALQGLADTVAAAVEPFAARDRYDAFRPHVTLARAARRADAPPDLREPGPREPGPEVARWTVGAFALVESRLTAEGPRYRQVSSHDLR